MKKKVLKQRIHDLEHANRLMFDVLSVLFEKQKPKFGHWPMFALRDGLSAEEADDLQVFWTWAMRQDHTTVTKEALEEYYAAMMPPRLQGKLPAIAEAELRDGLRVRIAKIALGLDPTTTDDDGEAS